MYLYTDKYFAWTRRRRKVERTKGTRQIFGGGCKRRSTTGLIHTHVTILIVVMRISSESKVHDNYLALVLEVYIY